MQSTAAPPLSRCECAAIRIIDLPPGDWFTTARLNSRPLAGAVRELARDLIILRRIGAVEDEFSLTPRAVALAAACPVLDCPACGAANVWQDRCPTCGVWQPDY